MSPRLLLITLVALLAIAAPAHAVAPISLDLRGIEHDRGLGSGDEREVIRAEGAGGTLVLRETVECRLKGARCAQLHHAVAGGACEESLIHGVLTIPRGTLRLRGVGRVCAGARDRERLWLIGYGGSGALRGVRALLEVRVAKVTQAGGAGDADTVSVDTVAVDTLGADGHPGARASRAASEQCRVCELLVSVVHEGQMHGDRTEDQHVQQMARVCALLPDAWAGECATVLERDGHAILRYAMAGYSAEAICVRLLGLGGD